MIQFLELISSLRAYSYFGVINQNSFECSYYLALEPPLTNYKVKVLILFLACYLENYFIFFSGFLLFLLLYFLHMFYTYLKRYCFKADDWCLFSYLVLLKTDHQYFLLLPDHLSYFFYCFFWSSSFLYCINNELHHAFFEIFITKIHVIFLFGKFVHLAEFIHIELPDKRWQMFMSKEMG